MGCPSCEFGLDCVDDVSKIFEITIVQATTTCELPHSLDGIKFGTIRGKEIQSKMLGLFLPPRLVESRVVIRGIVRDYHHSSPGATAGLAELAEKLKKAKPIEFAGLRAKHKTPIAQTHGSEIPYASASRSMQENRVLNFWRNPHSAAGAMLLKVDFVRRPEIDVAIPHQVLKFFLCAF